jgi:mannose-6-phosphate isomerase
MPSSTPLYPLRFTPLFKRLIWGGRRLATVLGKAIGPEPDYAESWELADHGSDVSRVANGPLAGTSLRELIELRSADLLGADLAGLEQFPLLVKVLDAQRDLSVQVHPDDALGHRLVQDNGKTEAWVILEAEPGSRIYAGLQPGTTREAFARAIEWGEVEPLLHRFEPHPGDCVFIPAGTVHAIGAGVLLAEIQQMSDATFRVFDWNRVGPDGRPRTLHVAESLEATDYDAPPVRPIAADASQAVQPLVSCPYFTMERHWLGDGGRVGSLDLGGRFAIVMGLSGRTVVRSGGQGEVVERGETVLLPASLEAGEMEAEGGASSVLVCQRPAG